MRVDLAADLTNRVCLYYLLEACGVALAPNPWLAAKDASVNGLLSCEEE